MASWTTYKGMNIPDSTTGDAGGNLKGDLTTLADRAPNKSTSDPTTTDDLTKGYFLGSHWLNTTTQVMWVCTGIIPNNAQWRTLYQRIDGGIILCPGTTTSQQGIQFGSGGDSRGNTAVDLQTLRTSSSQVASGAGSCIAGGKQNTASGVYSHAEGNGCIASGGGSHAEGGFSIASGYNSHAEGTNGSTASGGASHAEGRGTTASGQNSHSEGYYATASAAYSHAEGWGTTANQIGAHAEGSATTASGSYAHAEGSNTYANGNNAHAGGTLSKAHLDGQWARASGGHGGQLGTAQTTITHLFVRTTNSTATEMTLDGNSAVSGNRFSIVTGQTLSCLINIVGRKESGNTNDHGSFLRQICIRRTSSTTQLVGSVQTVGTDINPSNWGPGSPANPISITADDTNDSLKIEVAGTSSTNIRWMATVIASEVADAAI